MGSVKNLKDLYEADGHEWYLKNAKLIKENKLSQVDLENVAEELESMGRYERDKLESFFVVLFLHLLKLKYQSEFEVGVRGWKLSVKEHRNRIHRHLKNNPSLKGYLGEIVLQAYDDARIEAAKETGLKEEVFPETMPFLLEDALKDEWLP